MIPPRDDLVGLTLLSMSFSLFRRRLWNGDEPGRSIGRSSLLVSGFGATENRPTSARES
jgi:hypothetical protein